CHGHLLSSLAKEKKTPGSRLTTTNKSIAQWLTPPAAKKRLYLRYSWTSTTIFQSVAGWAAAQQRSLPASNSLICLVSGPCRTSKYSNTPPSSRDTQTTPLLPYSEASLLTAWENRAP